MEGSDVKVLRELIQMLNATMKRLDETNQNGGALRGNGRVEKDERWYRTLPRFDGEDPFGWLFQVKNYFLINSIAAEDEKLEVAVACLVGKALTWFIWFETKATVQSWSEFKREVIKQFHKLFSAKQELSKENEENKPAEVEAKMQEEEIDEEQTELQPVTSPKSFEADRSDSLSPKEAATEKKVEEELRRSYMMKQRSQRRKWKREMMRKKTRSNQMNKKRERMSLLLNKN